MPTRWGWPAAGGTAGAVAGSATTGTRCSPRTGSAGTPRRSTTSPPSSPASAATGRPGCATSSAPSRPTRTPSSAQGPAAPSLSTVARARGRPSSRCTVRRTSSYSDPRLGHRRGGVLFVGPHQPYLAYVADVLPSLGEEGVQTCTLRDLLPEGAAAQLEGDPEVARLKSSADMVKAISRLSGSTRSHRPRGWRSRPPGQTSGSAPTTGPRRSTRRHPVCRTTRRATRSGTRWSRSCDDKHDDEDVSLEQIGAALGGARSWSRPSPRRGR